MKRRLTVTDVVRETGICPDTVRKYADQGTIPHVRDHNGWRVFSEKSIAKAREIFGINTQKPSSTKTV